MYFEDIKLVKSDQVEAELKQRSVSKEEQDKMLKLLQREQCLSSDDEGTIDVLKSSCFYLKCTR